MIDIGLFKKNKIIYDADQEQKVEWPDHILVLDSNNFIKFIEKYPLSIVDFWAPWCSPCKAMAPRLRRILKIYKKKIAIGKLDIQKNKKIAKQYKIMGIPHFIFFRNGKIVSNITGIKTVGEIKTVIEDILKKMDK